VHSAFAGAMNEILLVAAIVAFAGAALGLALVRGRDFVVSHPAVAAVGGPTAPSAAEAEPAV
jgi:hypothetical protein